MKQMTDYVGISLNIGKENTTTLDIVLSSISFVKYINKTQIKEQKRKFKEFVKKNPDIKSTEVEINIGKEKYELKFSQLLDYLN